MGIKYYELNVKKLVNFAGEAYALVSYVDEQVALKLSETDFDLFKNGVTQLGDAAARNVGTSAGNVVVVGDDGKISSNVIPTVAISEDLGHHVSWAAAETGVAHTPEINDIIYIKDEGEDVTTESIYICVNPSATTFKDKFILLKAGEGAVSLTDFLLHTGDANIHITADERTAWNKKLDAEDIVAGNNITVTVNEDGTVTITGAQEYSLPTATAEVKGGIKLGDGLEADANDTTGETIQAVAKVKETFTTNTAVGNIAKGAEIAAGTTLDSLLKQLLVTYINPSFSTFASSNLGGTVEVGTNVAGPVAFNWKFTDWTYTKDNIVADSIVIRETNASGDVIAEGLAVAETGSYTSDITNIILTEPGSVTYYIAATNTKGTVFSKTLSKTWAYKYFYGTTTETTLPSVEDMRKANSALSPKAGTSFTITANDGDALAWFAYPASLRDVSSIIALDSMNAEVKSGFTYGTIDMIIADGTTTVSYKYGYIKPDSPFTQTARYKVTI